MFKLGKSVIVQRNDEVGRYALANLHFNPGDIIFSETPFAFGPKSGSPPLCLGCYIPTDCSSLCSTCYWPVCGKTCELIPAHRIAECEVFSKAKVRFQAVESTNVTCLQYECVTPLRVLLAKSRNPERWNEEIEEMESHDLTRRELPIWKINQINIVNYLRGPCKLKDIFSEELIHKICGILESNAFEARSSSGYPIRCLFPKLAILSHNCVSNITHSILCTGVGDENDLRVTVRAATRIKQNEELFSSYTYSLWPTLFRRTHLRESKYFDCSCSRCSDPCELGTHISSLICKNCHNGIVTSTAPQDFNANWKCSSCGFIQTKSEVEITFLALQEEIDLTYKTGNENDRLQILEGFIQKQGNLLNPQNAFLCIAKSNIIDIYGKLKSPDKNILIKQINYCNNVLKILDIIEPGFTRIRGITLYELFKARMHLIVNDDRIFMDRDGFKQNLQETLHILEESAGILKLEPMSSVEGKLGVLAKKSVAQLQGDLNNIINHNEIEMIKILKSILLHS